MWNFDPENVPYSQTCFKQTPGGCSIPVNKDLGLELLTFAQKSYLDLFFFVQSDELCKE